MPTRTPQAHPMTEAELKHEVITMARAQGWAVFHLPNVPLTNSGVGYPDLTLARDGEVLFMELKTEKGTLSIEQYRWMAALPAFHVIRPSDLSRGRVDELLA